MTDLRTAAKQALEALEKLVVGSEYEEAVEAERAMEAIRAALAEPQIDPVDEYRKGFIAGQIDMRDREQAEPVQEPDPGEYHGWVLREVLFEKGEPVGHREPVQEPVAWMYHGIRHDGTPHDRPSLIWRPEYMDAMSAKKGAKATPLYTSPPQRKPLTDEDAAALIELDPRMLTEFGTAPSGAAMELIRRTERAHGIGGQE